MKTISKGNPKNRSKKPKSIYKILSNMMISQIAPISPITIPSVDQVRLKSSISRI